MTTKTDIPSSSSSSSSSPPFRKLTYDVFLSFRGEDTRKNFTDHLYSALTDKGIITFRDDEELERGEAISLNLLKAIEESRYAVVVLSRNYANSSWCLNEIAKVVECMKTMGQTVLPVFYDVDPYEVRHQTGDHFGKAFANHQKQFEGNPDMVQTWKLRCSCSSSQSRWVAFARSVRIQSYSRYCSKDSPRLEPRNLNIYGGFSRDGFSREYNAFVLRHWVS